MKETKKTLFVPTARDKFFANVISRAIFKKIESSNLFQFSNEDLAKIAEKIVFFEKKLLTEAEAAEFLGVSPGTLSVWRSKGKGPSYSKIGSSVRYNLASLLGYIERNKIAIN